MAIIKEAMLILVSGQANSNKFYHVTLSGNGTVTKRWGRVGTDGTSSTEAGGENAFDRIVRAKEKKGYVQTDVITLAESSGEEEKLSKIAHNALISKNSSQNTVITDLVDELVRLNNHDILETSGGMIKINNSGLITTPLGLISSSSIHSAKSILREIETTSVSSSNYSHLLEDYLKLIPQKVGARRGWEKDFFNDDNTFTKQADFLKQLSDSLSLQADRKKVQEEAVSDDEDYDAKYEKLFKLRVGLLENKREFRRIEKMFESSKTKFHATSNLSIKRIYSLHDDEGQQAFDQKVKQVGNKMELWHGTGANNVLSILRRGLYCPPANASNIHISGRMYGDGLYFSNISSKSSQYLSFRSSGSNRSFMFLADVAMGRTYYPDGYYPYGSNKVQVSGQYDSIFAQGGKSGVLNNEMIIWNTDQINLRYIIELGL